MSRVGKKSIPVPKGVQISIANQVITVKGPKGTLEQNLTHDIIVKVEGEEIVVSFDGEEGQGKEKFQGLYRALINNMVLGVFQGFSRRLELVGIGYRAAVQGKALDLQLGYSHPTRLAIPDELQVAVDKNVSITISGANKQQVGQFAAEVRAMRPPEPYKGKGIRYEGEYVRKKAGKTGKGKGK